MHNRLGSHSPFNEDASFLIPEHQLDRMPLELQELCEAQSSDCSRVERAAAVSDWPVSLFVPDRYEAKYAYPLLIWFHDDGSSEAELNPVMESIGNQNYCGLALRGNSILEGDDSFGWNCDALEVGNTPFSALVNVTARRLRRAFHIHSERIFAAGSGTGADVAAKLFAAHPDWFGGAVLIDPPCRHPLQLANVSELRGKPVLHTVSRSADNNTLARNLESVRLLRSAGADIDVRVTAESLDPCSNHVRFVDHWLMTSMKCATYA